MSQGTTPASISPLTLVCMVTASMIGAGVFTTSGFALADLKDARLVLLAWVIGGVLAVAGAIGYGALAARLPGSGGEYLYLSRSIHPSIGFLAGWISLTAGFTAPIAAAALTFSSYLWSGQQVSGSLITCSAIAAILVTAGFNSFSRLAGTSLQNVTVFIKLILISVFVIAAFLAPVEQWHANRPLPEQALPGIGATIIAVAGSVVWISLSYIGFNAAIYVAGESKSQQIWVPRSMVIATIIVTIIYLILNAIFVFGAPYEQIAGKEQVATIAARSLLGANFERLIQVIACLANLTSVQAMILAGPRVFTQMAEDGVMPKLFKPRADTPRIAIWIQSILACIVVANSDIKQLLGYLGITLSLCAVLTVACVFLPSKETQVATTIWWQKLGAGIYLSGTLALIAIAAPARINEVIASAVTVAIGAVLFFIWKTLPSTNRAPNR